MPTNPNPFLRSSFDAVADQQAAPVEPVQAPPVAQSPVIPSIPMPERAAPEVAAPAPIVPAARAPADNLAPPPELRDVFEASARAYNVPVNVLMALGHQESRYDPAAVGQPTKWGRAKGVMQFLDSTADGLGINPLDPNQAIPAAAKQLRDRLDKGYSMDDAVKEHFAGPDRNGWGEKTRVYGDEVLAKAGQIGQMLYAGKPAEGQVTPGNIDLNARPVVKNPDGTISTVRSMSVNIDGKEVLIPTVSDDGRVLSNEAAIQQFKQTGKHLGIFDSVDSANAYAEQLHKDQAKQYGDGPAAADPNQAALDKLNGVKPNSFSTSMPRSAYLATFQSMNPQAGPAAIQAIMAQYDKDQEARNKAGGNRVQDKFAQMQSPEATFNAKLNKKLQAGNEGLAQALPGNAQPANPAGAPKERPGIVDQAAGDFGRGIDNLKALGYGSAGLAADASGQDADATDFLTKYVAIQNDIAKNNPATIGTYKNIKGMGDAGRYAIEAVAENLPMLIPAVLTGGIGAFSAKAAAQRLVVGMVEKQVAAGVARTVAEQQAAKFVARTILGGQVAGAAASSIPMEAGSIMGDIYQDTGKKAAGTALAYGIPAGLLDTIEPVMALRKVAGPIVDQVAGSIIKRLGVEAGKQFLTEAGTEGLQTILEEAGKASASGKKLMTPELLDNVVDSMLKGGIGGAGIGVASQGVHEARGAVAERMNTPGHQVADAINGNVAATSFADADAVARARMDPNAGTIDPSQTAMTPEQRAAAAPAPVEPAAPPAPAPAPAGPLATAVHAAVPVAAPAEDTFTIQGDDGTVHQLAGDTITPVAPPAGPLSGAVAGAAADHAVNPAAPPEMPAAPVEAPAPPPLESLSTDDLRGQLKQVTGAIKEGRTAELVSQRNAIQKEINARAKEAAAETAKLAEEPTSMGPFDTIEDANKMAPRVAEKTAVVHEVVKRDGKFHLQPYQENTDGTGNSNDVGNAGNDRGPGNRDAGGDKPAVGNGNDADRDVLPAARDTGAPAGTGRVGNAKGDDAAGGSADGKPALKAKTGNPMIDNPASWVIKEKSTGKIIMETFDKKKVAALNTEKYEAVPIHTHLAGLNGKAAPSEQVPVPAATAPEWETNPYHARQFATEAYARKFMADKQVDGEKFEAVQTAPARWKLQPKAEAVPAVADLTGKQIDKEWHEFAKDSGTLNVDRAEMPQVKAEHRGALTQFLLARGIAHEQLEMPAGDLKPTQREFSPAKVEKAKNYEGGERSILVSSDNHVLDGHHQWLAKMDSNEPVKVIKLDAPIKKLLAEVKEFPSAEARDGATAAATDAAPAAEKVPEVAPEASTEPAKVIKTQQAAREEAIAALAEQGTKSLREVAANHKRTYMREAAANILAERAEAVSAQRSQAMKQRMKRDSKIDTDVDHMAQALAKMGGINRESARGRMRLAPEEMNVKANVGNLARNVFVKNGGMTMDQAGAAMAELGYVSHDEHGKHDQSEWEDALSQVAGGDQVYTAAGMVARAEAERAMEMDELQAKSEAEYQEIEHHADALEKWADDHEIVLPDDQVLYHDEHDAPLISEKDIHAYFEQGEAEGAGRADSPDSTGQARAGAETGADAPAEGTEFLQSQSRQDLAAKDARANDQALADKELADSQVSAFSLSAPDGSVTGEANAMSNSRQENFFDISNEKTIEVDGVRRPINNSAGRPVAQTFAGQMAFWKFFGDSKIVDEKGRPLVMFHGTAKDFSAFDNAKTGGNDEGLWGRGHYFASSPVSANSYALRQGDGARVMQAYISLKNPLILRTGKDLITRMPDGTNTRDLIGQNLDGAKIKAIALSGRHDGVIQIKPDGSIGDVVAFQPEQIKSATGNNGQFDSADADITHDLSALMADGPLSRLEEPKRVVVLAELKRLQRLQAAGKMTAESYRAQVDALIGRMTERNAARENAKAVDRERGADWVEERLMRAKRQGDLDADTVDFALWALRKSPSLAADLAISLKSKTAHGSAGSYGSAERIMTLLKNGTNSGTAVHEMLHHTERMMPAAIQHGINKAWFKAYMAAWDKADPATRPLVEDLLAGGAGDKAAFDRIIKAFREGKLIYAEHYQLVNQSEFWAVNATRIMAGRFDASTKGWGAKAKQWLTEMVQHLRGLLGMQSDAPILKGLDQVLNGDGTMVSKKMLGQLPVVQDATAFDISAAADPQAAADTGLTPPEQGLARRVQAAIQNNQNRVKQVQDRIESLAGVPIKREADYYGAETNRPGRIATRLEDGSDTMLEPLMARLAKSGYMQAQLESLLHAMHAEERNAAVARINPQHDPASADYVGTQGSGMDDDVAQAILATYADAVELHEIAQQARDIAKATLDLKQAYGLISDERRATLDEAYDNYVPLKGDGEYGPKMKRAMGHTEREENIMGNIARDYAQAVVVGEKNLARQSLLQMVLRHPDDALWTARVPPKGRYIAGEVFNVKRNGSTVAQFTDQSQVAAYLDGKGAEAGQYTVETSSGEQVVEFTKPLQDNEVMVYVKGQGVRLQIHDEVLAAQLRPLDNGQMGVVLEAMRSLNRHLSKVYTGYNPSFILRNTARDALTGTINMLGNEGASIAAKAWTKYPAALATLVRWAHSKQVPSGAMGDYLREYRDHGGKVGASWMSDLEQQGKSLNAMFDDAAGLARTAKSAGARRTAALAWRKTVGKLAHVIEVINQGTENALRLSLFVALRQAGQTPAQAAQAAKGVTVNFDRKGTSTPALGAFYLFLNPAIQGTANAANTLSNGKHKYQAWAALGGLATLGYALAAHGMDDDKDRWLGRQWDERTKNFILRIGTHELKIPVSQEFAPFFAFGTAMAEASRGESKMSTAARLFSSFVDAYFPLNGAYRADGDNHPRDLALSVVPTILKPYSEIAFNVNAFGSDLMPESAQTKDRPDNLKMFRGTKNSPYDKAAQAIAAGGVALGARSYENDISKVSPETLKLLWRTYTGGLGGFIADSTGVTGMALEDASQIESGDIPIVKDFWRPVDVKPVQGRLYDLERSVRAINTEFKLAAKAGDAAAIQQLASDPEVARVLGVTSMVAKINKAAGELADQAVDVNSDKSLTGAEKRAKLKEIDAQREQLYRVGIDAFK